ncbi:MAG TPA: PASTA domain-containing protein [Bacteroidales bacterium]|nr:PASTA domain-containing protein [Bacteroidales bacterium]HRX98066.1 PASTA domain-containing protein [Bacteroidales bacterium]
MQDPNNEKSSFFRFLISKKFFINIAIAVVVLVLLFFVLIKYLDIYTRHGKELTMPDFYGQTLQEIDSAGYSDFYDFEVIDSLYDDNNKAGAVVIQNPLPGAQVKKGRHVYFTIVASTAEQVIMPDLRDLTLRQAINILELNKLGTGKLIYQPSFDKNAVLAQFYKNDTIHPGDTLVKGALIDLVIGSGDRNYKIPVPFLIGKTREEAIYELNIASFNLGNEFYMDSVQDDLQRVFMQEPRWDAEISYYPGDSIHLWYRSDTAVDFDAYLQTFLPDSLRNDSLAVDSNFVF